MTGMPFLADGGFGCRPILQDIDETHQLLTCSVTGFEALLSDEFCDVGAVMDDHEEAHIMLAYRAFKAALRKQDGLLSRLENTE